MTPLTSCPHGLCSVGSCSDCSVNGNPALRPQPSGETREAVRAMIVEAHAQYVARNGSRYVPCKEWFDEIADAVSARPLALGDQQGEVKRVRHKKRGTEYTIIGVGRAQGEISDEDPVVLYRGDTDGSLWVRHQAEFSDGRFEYVTTPARAEAQDEGAAGEPVQPYAWIWRDMTRLGLGFTRDPSVVAIKREQGCKIQPLYAHPSPTPAADADRVRSALTDLVSWFDKPVQGERGMVWVIRGGDQGADDAVAEALAALKSTAAKEGGVK